MRLVLISDTHGYHRAWPLPEGDVLIHAGDITSHGLLSELEDFNRWLGEQPHPHKLVIAGNHDFCLERAPETAAARLTSATYLQDQAVEIGGLRFYGSPWQPRFQDMAFNLPRGPELEARWALIPPATDVLITHGPPWKHGDRTFLGQHVGCRDLLARLQVLQPRLHVFGHIHEAYGQSIEGRTRCVNASRCTLWYDPHNPPVIVDLEPSTAGAPPVPPSR